MTRHNGRASLRVISGGARTPQAAALPLPPAPDFGPEELAADMAVLFALGLAQDLPAAGLGDPHARLATGGTLHELLCELRNLRWFDADECLSLSPGAVSSPACAGEAGRRRVLWRNGDGQLTLRTLMRGAVALRGPEAGLSALPVVVQATAPDAPPPGAAATLADWAGWARAARGMTGETRAPDRLRSLSEAVQAMPAGAPFWQVALTALDQGVPLASGLEHWTSGRMLALLAEAERAADRIALTRARDGDRLCRPAVTAARLSVALSREDRAPVQPVLAEAAQSLAEAAPRLLDWMGAANTRMRGAQRLGRSLFLPLCPADTAPAQASDLARHALVAGAMATLQKALFDTAPLGDAACGRARMPGNGLDRLCADVARARCVAGTHFPAENHQDLRIGEMLALTLLRQALEQDNRPAELALVDFDGARIVLRCHRRSFGRGMATLLRDGKPRPWPQAPGHRAAHLTAVSQG